MTIQIANNNPRISYTATGGQTAFPTSFAFFDEGDINVYINDVLKALNTDYTVSGGSGAAGTVTLITGATAGDIIVLTRDVELERTTDFPTSGPFQVASLNVELDKIIAMIADMEDFAGRGLRLSDSDTSAALVLANKDARKGTVLAFNTVTGAVEVGPTIADTQSIADIKADIALLADIQDGTTATDAITDLATIASDVTTAANNIAAIQGASTQAANAATSATEAATSASSAATSASAAANSATAAETAETNAETAQANAETAETNAATSATASASSATASAGSATAAAASATAAVASATAAQIAETNAETAETNAELAETNASTSATAAAGSATAAASSATAAASSATAAASSATAAATSETNAATSETNAATSATAAASSATAAAGSATSASAAQSAAESARDSALSAYDNFDDRYLGPKASDPTTDNDGDALVGGTLYFNTTDNSMKLYTGTVWVDSYANGSDFVPLTGATMTGDLTVPNLDVTSNVTVGGTVDGRDVAADGTKLDGIEAAADVTDTANVTAAGAAMLTGATFTGNVSVTGDLTVDTDTLYVDSTNNRVGIGTTSPSRQLHVSGSGVNTRLRVENTTGSNILDIYAEDGGNSTLNYSSVLTMSESGTERMRIDSSGNVGIGTNSPSSNLHVNGDSQRPVIFQRNTTDGNIVDLSKNGTTIGQIGTLAGNTYIGSSNTGLRFQESSLSIFPCNSNGSGRDNAIDVGNPSVRFDDIRATNGTIQTSDRNDKQQIASLTDAEVTAAKVISTLFKTFKWNDKVEEKGDAARTHTGVIAQDVQQAMTDVGLDAGDYAFFISDTWWEVDGEFYDTAEEAPEGATERTRLGIRYPELLAFVGAATEQRLASIETRLAALETN